SAHPSLLENGKQVAGFEAENLGRSKSVVLAVDRSQSMAGRSLADATTAARAFVDAKPEVDRVAVVTFGSKPILLTTFTSATGDTYYPAASTGVLRKIYASIATELSRTWRLSYLTTARPGDKIELRASVPGLGSATQKLTIPGSADNGAPKPSGLLPAVAYTSSLGTLFLTLLVGFLVLVAAGIALAAQKGSWLRGRLEAH